MAGAFVSITNLHASIWMRGKVKSFLSMYFHFLPTNPLTPTPPLPKSEFNLYGLKYFALSFMISSLMLDNLILTEMAQRRNQKDKGRRGMGRKKILRANKLVADCYTSLTVQYLRTSNLSAIRCRRRAD